MFFCCCCCCCVCLVLYSFVMCCSFLECCVWECCCLSCCRSIFVKLIQLNFAIRRRIRSKFLSFSFKSKGREWTRSFARHSKKANAFWLMFCSRRAINTKISEYAMHCIYIVRCLIIFSLLFFTVVFVFCCVFSLCRVELALACLFVISCVSFSFRIYAVWFFFLVCERMWYFWVYRCRCFCYFRI